MKSKCISERSKGSSFSVRSPEGRCQPGLYRIRLAETRGPCQPCAQQGCSRDLGVGSNILAGVSFVR